MTDLPELTAETFRLIGQLLFGERYWQQAIGKRLQRSQRHIHFIHKEQRPPPQTREFREKLISLIGDRLLEIGHAKPVAATPREQWTKEILIETAEALFGDRTWQASMRDKWDIPRPLMTRYRTGISPVPTELVEALRTELVQREDALRAVLGSLR